MSDRNQYLTEAMGFCWHHYIGYNCTCIKCETYIEGQGQLDFSTWNSFGKLWEWLRVQSWFSDFMIINSAGIYQEYDTDISIIYINPDKLASAVYKYLQGR